MEERVSESLRWLNLSKRDINNFNDWDRIRVLIRCCAVLLVVLSCSVTSRVSAEDFISIPKDTRVPIIIQSEISSEPLHGSKTFSATTKEDLRVDGKVVWPAGSIIKGDVIRNAMPPRLLERSSYMRLIFNSIQTPNGREQPLQAYLVDRNGFITFWREAKEIYVPSIIQLSCCGIGGGWSSVPLTGFDDKRPYGVAPQEICRSSIMIIKKSRGISLKQGDVTRIQLREDHLVPRSQIDWSQNIPSSRD